MATNDQPATSVPPPATPIPPEVSELLKSLASGDDKPRRLYQLERSWQQSADLAAARCELAEVKGVVIGHDVEIKGLTARVGKIEDKHDDFATRTGEHQMTEIRAELNRHEESKRHWVRWAIAALAMAATSVGTGCALHWLF
jgi:hypothetical protein